MTRRSDELNQPSSFKRRKLTDNATSKIHPLIRKGATSPPGIYECTLNLNGVNYLEARYIVKPMEKWLSMAKYRKLYVSDSANVSRISLTVNSTIGNQTLRVEIALL
jgi:hypothetical protein